MNGIPHSTLFSQAVYAQPNQKKGEVLERNLIYTFLDEQEEKKQYVISKEQVEKLLKLTQFEIDDLLIELTYLAQERAQAPLSEYKVGAAVLGSSGAIYLGMNWEFKGFQLNQTIHAEQFAFMLAKIKGEKCLVKMALSAIPCGHCLQFLSELEKDRKLIILNPHQPPLPITAYLPITFNLQINHKLKESEPTTIEHEDELIMDAANALKLSSSPYTQSPSSVAIEATYECEVFTGAYIEISAFNPSLLPFQNALISFISSGHAFNTIKRVVLLEKKHAKTEHALITEALVKSLAPQALFILHHF